MSKGKYSKGRIRTHVFDTISEHMCSDTTFLSGQNPYNTLVRGISYQILGVKEFKTFLSLSVGFSWNKENIVKMTL